MAWLVPYVINGAAHSAALFRRQAQRPATDQAGVSRPGDLKVTQLPAAATGFRIAQGGLSLPSRFPGRGRESYGVENGDAVIDVTDVPGTGSSARRDAVVVELLDPNYLPITHEDAALTNYMTVHVVQDVPAGAKTIDNITSFNNRTAYVLAFINWPASTTAITNAMIQDARRVAVPKRELHTRNYELSGAEESAIASTAAYPVGATWPSHAEVDAVWSYVDIPDWATRVRIVMTWSGVRIPGGAAKGYVWCMVGGLSDPNRVVTQGRVWDATRDGFRATGDVSIPAALRGTRQGFFPRATRITGTNATAPVLDSGSGLDLTVEFFGEAT